jgi:hypothetical protein
VPLRGGAAMNAWVLGGAYTIGGGLLLFILTTVGSANLRTWLQRRGLDQLLVKVEDHLPQVIRRVIDGWPYVRGLWFIWLALGISAGVAATLTALSTAPSNRPSSPVPVSATTQPSGQPQKPLRTAYSAAEKEDLRNATRTISKIIAEQGQGLAQKIDAALHVWDAMYNQGQISAPQELSDKLADLADSIVSLQHDLNGSTGPLRDFWDYHDDLTPLIGLSFASTSNNDPLIRLGRETFGFKSQVDAAAFAAKYNDKQLLKHITAVIDIVSFQNAQAAYLEWLKRTEERIKAFHDNL